MRCAQTGESGRQMCVNRYNRQTGRHMGREMWQTDRHMQIAVDRPVSTGPNAGWRVTLGIVLYRPSHVTPQLRQICRQLEHTVDSTNKHITCPPVDSKVSERGVECFVHCPARCQSGREWNSRGREEGKGEEGD